MSDWILAKWSSWIDKIKYIDRITGEDLQDLYNKMNLSETTHITATNIFPLGDLISKPQMFTAFIFYKDKYGNIKM